MFWIPHILFWQHWRGTTESSTTLYRLNAEPNPPALYWMCILLQRTYKSTKATFQNIRQYSHRPVKAKRRLRGFYTHTSANASHQLWSMRLTQSVTFTRPGRCEPACIWFHREVVNMPAFSTSPLFWHAQLRRSSSKVSARGCGHCRSAFTHTTYASRIAAPQYGWMLLRVSPCQALDYTLTRR